MQEIAIQISAITTTVLTAQGSNDPTATTWDTIPVQDNKLQGAGALTLTAASTYKFQPSGFKYIRLQVTTTGTVLTVQGIYAKFGNTTTISGYGNAVAIANTPAVTISSGTVTTVSTVTAVSSVTSSQSAIPGTVADVASAAITTTTTTAAFTPTFGSSYMVNIPVTAVSGTTPTYSVQIQESADSGTNWYTVYTFPTITATGSYNSPVITLTGNRVRYVQTLTGTTPSFTRAINRLQSSQQNILQASGGILTDASGSTSATPSTSTQIMAAQQGRKYLLIQNVSSNNMWINFTSAATATQPSVQLLPGGSLIQESGFVSTEAVNVLSTVASQAYTAKWA